MRTERRTLRAVRRKVLAATLVVGVGAGTLAVPTAGADELTDKRAQAAQAAAKLDSLESRVMELGGEAEKAKGELDQAQTELDEASRRAEEANAERAAREAALQEFAVNTYVSGDTSGGVEAFMAGSGNEAAKLKGYAEITAGNSQDLIDELRATKRRADDQAAELDDARAALEEKNRKLEASLDEAEAAVAEQASIKNSLDGDVRQLVEAEERRKAEEAAQRAAAEAARQQAARPAAPSGGGGGGGGGAPRSGAPAPADPAPGPAPAPSGGAQAAVDAGMSKIGAPYVWAAAGPDTFDCSGFTMWAWKHGGKSLPHYTGSQLAMSRRISAAEAVPGDLVFFWSPGSSGDPGHVGLYIGGGRMVHAPGRGKFVRVDSVGYWSGARVAYGRV